MINTTADWKQRFIRTKAMQLEFGPTIGQVYQWTDWALSLDKDLSLKTVWRPVVFELALPLLWTLATLAFWFREVFVRLVIDTTGTLLIIAAAFVVFGSMQYKFGVGFLFSWMEPDSYERRDIPTGDLAGKRVGWPISDYLGIAAGQIPDTLRDASFRQNGLKLWENKSNMCNNVWPVVLTGIKLVEDYPTKPSFMTLSDLLERIDDDVEILHQEIDWELVGKKTRLNATRLETLKKVSLQVKGRELYAYALREIMPDGPDGAVFADFLLRTGGREYLAMIPALSDKELSFGDWQFTSRALSEDNDRYLGASILNHCLPKHLKIPSEVSLLRGDDHHRAAWLLAVYNLSLLVKMVSVEKLAWLEEAAKPRELSVYLGLMHHRPVTGIKAAAVWISDPRHTISTATPNEKDCQDYAKDTENHYNTLRQWASLRAGLFVSIFIKVIQCRHATLTRRNSSRFQKPDEDKRNLVRQVG